MSNRDKLREYMLSPALTEWYENEVNLSNGWEMFSKKVATFFASGLSREAIAATGIPLPVVDAAIREHVRTESK